VKIYLFGAGNIGKAFHSRLGTEFEDVYLVSSGRFERKKVIEGENLPVHYGELSSSVSNQQDLKCIITSRVDKLSDSDQNALFSDLQQLDKRGADFLNLSSVAVYGTSKNPRNEYSEIMPVNEYGKNKVKIEEAIMNIVNPKRLLNLRIANLYGDAGFNDVTNAAIAAGHGNKSIPIPLNDTFRDYVSYRDLEQFMLDWITNNSQVHGSVNFASGVSRSVSEWIEILKNLTGMDISVTRSFDEPLQYSFIDAKRLQEIWPKKLLEPSDGLRLYSEISGHVRKDDKN
jgi:hypothetical protein